MARECWSSSGGMSSIVSSAPRTSAARSASTHRVSRLLGTVAIAITTRSPALAWRAMVPPMPISRSSGWAPKARTRTSGSLPPVPGLDVVEVGHGVAAQAEAERLEGDDVGGRDVAKVHVAAEPLDEPDLLGL